MTSKATDADGNEYLDMSSGQICAVAGHGHPVLLERVIDQIRRVAHTGTSFFSPIVFEASERLMAVVPGELEKCLFLSTGAEANEYALRLAKVHTGKTGVLALTKGYAGLTLQTSNLTNYGKSAKPIVPGTGYLQVPDPTMCPAGRDPLDWARELLDQSLEVNRGLLDNVAAITFEPILSAGGLIVLPDGYLRELRALATRLGALLIADWHGPNRHVVRRTARSDRS
jgi:2,2-dialkylglycine decarboxylase (pyruvate)